MGYSELLKALEDEVVRQIRQIEEETGLACERLATESRQVLTAGRQDALARERQRLDEEARRVVSRAHFDQSRTLLAEQRRLLTDLRREAEQGLRALDDTSTVTRLVDELMPELGDGPVEFRVSKGREAAFISDLARRHPELARRATVAGVDITAGGVVAALNGGRQLLDNSLQSRLEKAWQQLEGVLAAELFGDTTDDSRV